MPDSEFAYFLLVGERFKAHGMPVDAFTEVVAFRDAVLSVARELYMREHPDRARVARNFRQQLDLRIASVEGGSARPLIMRHLETDVLDIGGDYFDEARDLITRALRSIN